MTGDTIYLDAEKLTRALAALYRAVGSSDVEALQIADHLVASDLTGHPSHGTGMTPIYLENLANGRVIPNRIAERVPVRGDLLLFDGGTGYGQSIGLQVADAVAATVQNKGVAVFALRNVHHLGRIGTYGEHLAGLGVLSAVFVNVASRPLVAPFGGAAGRLGTNPVCITIPRPDAPPVVLDFATSTIAMGKVRVALESGLAVPEGTLIDADGLPTTDPQVMFSDPSGALVPMAEHKGGGLNVVCELLAAAVNGAIAAEAHEDGPIQNTMVGMAFDAGDVSRTGTTLETAIRHFLASPMQQGRVARLPGDLERENRKRLSITGVPMPTATWETIIEAGRERGASGDLFHAAEMPHPGNRAPG